MPRAMWRGTISFGMVAIPVRLHVATEERSSVSFHLLCKKDGSRLRNLRWCPTENREVPWDEVVRGYEIGRDEYVVLTPEDLERLPLPSARTIEIHQFCERDEIPDLYLDRAYYIEPEEAGRKPYALLRAALERSGRVAVGKVALREREHLAQISWLDGALVLETLHWPEEIRDTKDLKLPETVSVGKAEIDMALMLVESLSRPFTPSDYHDEYREALLALVAEKQGTGTVERPAAAEPAKVVDLMEALKASVEAARRGGGGDGHRQAAPSRTRTSSSRGGGRKKAG
jgi:DNA end-binding protein Ku